MDMQVNLTSHLYMTVTKLNTSHETSKFVFYIHLFLFYFYFV